MTSKILPKKITSINVANQHEKLGLLTHGAVYNYQPTSDDAFVSLTMTRRDLRSYNSGALHPIFSQNLPEGFNRRFIAERLARYAKLDDMYLLALQQNNGIGQLCYQSELQLDDVEPLSLTDILDYQGTESLFPQLLERYYLRNAVSGVQPKVSISNITDRTVPQPGVIVKTYDEAFPLLTVNEYVCMQAAQACGLAPPATYLSNDLQHFVIERFDRPNGQWLGYEDFTTLMKRANTPDAKYQGSYEALLRATMLYTNNLQEVTRMYRYIVFNCLIGNGDAHLKNFALQYTPDMNAIFVSPPFDITHTLIYEDIDNKMALKMAGSKEFPSFNHLLALADGPGFKIRGAKDIIHEFAQRIEELLVDSEEVKLIDGLKESISRHLSRTMHQTATVSTYRHDKKRKYPK